MKLLIQRPPFEDHCPEFTVLFQVVQKRLCGVCPAPAIHPLMIGTEQHYFLCCVDKIGFCFLLVFDCLNTVLGKRPEGITESLYHVVMESYLSSPWSPTVGEEDPVRAGKGPFCPVFSLSDTLHHTEWGPMRRGVTTQACPQKGSMYLPTMAARPARPLP